jgi:ribosomal protein S18 acetylase RimI-like enzyme
MAGFTIFSSRPCLYPSERGTALSANLTFRVDGLADPAKRAAWVDLLRDIFESDFAEFGSFGIWHEGFRAFSWMDGDVIAANVASRPLPLVIDGRRVAAGQIHSVATRPRYRRRGLFKDLMRRALADADTRFDCVLLYTNTPELYRPFGFRPVPEHRFRGRLCSGDATALRPASKELSIRESRDRSTILSLFAARRPVSDRLALIDNHDILVINALFHPGWRLSFLPEENTLIVWDRADGTTRLLDIVGRQIPSAPVLAAILGLPLEPHGRSAELDVLFPPDLLGGTFTPFRHLGEEGDVLCVRGPFAIEGTPYMLPLTAMS